MASICLLPLAHEIRTDRAIWWKMCIWQNAGANRNETDVQYAQRATFCCCWMEPACGMAAAYLVLVDTWRYLGKYQHYLQTMYSTISCFFFIQFSIHYALFLCPHWGFHRQKVCSCCFHQGVQFTPKQQREISSVNRDKLF